jgi:hypothetical protein
VKKAVSSGSALSALQIYLLSRSTKRRGPRNDIHVVQRVAWTNVGNEGIAEHGADIYE